MIFDPGAAGVAGLGSYLRGAKARPEAGVIPEVDSIWDFREQEESDAKTARKVRLETKTRLRHFVN
jgi:hypothetical protein